MKKEINNRPLVLLISPHSKVRLSESVSYGFERRISFLGRIISERYNTIIIEPDDGFPDKKENVRKVSFKSFSSIKVRNLRLGSLFLDINPFYIFKLISILKKSKPSVVIISFPFGIPISAIVIKKILKLNSILIYNSHNVETEYSKIIAKDENLPWIAKFFYCKYISIIERFAVMLSDRIIAVSEENKNIFYNNYFCNIEKFIVINLGADIPKDVPKSNNQFKKNKNEIFAVFHGTYKATHNRNAIDIIHSYLAERLKEYKRLKFIVAGNGVPKIEKDNIISFGFVENLYDLLSSCDIAIVPLEEGEGTKLKLFDYMAAGLPIITTKKGAEGMGLIDGENAFITNHVNDDFVKAIENLVNDPIMREDFGHRAKNLIEKEFHPEVVKKKMYKFLDDIIDKAENS